MTKKGMRGLACPRCSAGQRSSKSRRQTEGDATLRVSKAGAVVGWVNGRGYDHCLAQLARIDGYTVWLGAQFAKIAATKEAVAAKLATFTDVELAAVRLSRKNGKK
jgi:hypothetical protein